MNKREALLNCFTDLQRAATAYYLRPGGAAAGMFLSHAREILEKLGTKETINYLSEIDDIERLMKLSTGKRSAVNISDQILTLGVILKPAI